MKVPLKLAFKIITCLTLIFDVGCNRKPKTNDLPKTEVKVERKKGVKYFSSFDQLRLIGIDEINGDIVSPYVEIEETDDQLIVRTVDNPLCFEKIYMKKGDYYFQSDTISGDISMEYHYYYWKNGIKYLWEYMYDHDPQCRKKITLSYFSWENDTTRRSFVNDFTNACSQKSTLLNHGPFIPIIDTSIIYSYTTESYKIVGDTFSITDLTFEADGKERHRDERCYILKGKYKQRFYEFSSAYVNEVDCKTMKPIVR